MISVWCLLLSIIFSRLVHVVARVSASLPFVGEDCCPAWVPTGVPGQGGSATPGHAGPQEGGISQRGLCAAAGRVSGYTALGGRSCPPAPRARGRTQPSVWLWGSGSCSRGSRRREGLSWGCWEGRAAAGAPSCPEHTGAGCQVHTCPKGCSVHGAGEQADALPPMPMGQG